MFPLHKKSCCSIFFFGCRSASSAKENHSTCRIWIYTGKNDLAAWFICSQVFLSHHPRMSSAASGPVHQDEYGRPDPMALGLSFNESGRKERFDLSFLVLFSLHNSPIYTSHIIHSIHSFIRPTSPLPSLERPVQRPRCIGAARGPEPVPRGVARLPRRVPRGVRCKGRKKPGGSMVEQTRHGLVQTKPLCKEHRNFPESRVPRMYITIYQYIHIIG